MLSGQLESVDETALLGGANLCAIGDGTPDGWELVQFCEAELVGVNTYILRYRLRGQQGTEAAQPDIWPEGTYLVMLDGIPQQIELTDGQRRRARHYRIGPAGRSVDDPSYRHALIAFEGIGLRPLSPVHLHAVTDGAGDMSLSWIRRTREDGDRWDTPEVPLGEEREQYLIRIVVAGDVVREQVVTGPNWTYSAAMRSSDGVAGAYQVQVAQISARFGPGVFAHLYVPD